MSSDQRARLVLNPLTLVVALLIAGVMIGASYVLLRRTETNRAAAVSAAAADAGEIVLSSNEVDFGTLRADRDVVRQLLLRNHGSGPARLRIDAPGRVQAEPKNLEIPTDAIGRVFLTARSGNPGPWEEEIRVIREGSGGAPMVVRLRGSNHAGRNSAASAAGELPGGAVDVAYVDAALPADSGGEMGSTAARDTASTTASAPAGSVQITRTGGQAGGSGDSAASDSARATTQLPAGYTRIARSMADRPTLPSGEEGEDGEEPSPIHRKTPSDLEKKKEKDPPAGISALTVSSASTINLMGSTNVFSPQQVIVLGSASGGSFSLASPLQIPRVQLAFGQSMQFNQRGSAVGTFDAGSGQVVLTLAVDAVDSAGRSAPLVVQLTTASVVTRNTSGVLVSASGESRAAGSGQLRLVGIAKVPEGFRSGAEMELVTFDILATLQFASPSNDSSAGSSGGL